MSIFLEVHQVLEVLTQVYAFSCGADRARRTYGTHWCCYRFFIYMDAWSVPNTEKAGFKGFL